MTYGRKWHIVLLAGIMAVLFFLRANAENLIQITLPDTIHTFSGDNLADNDQLAAGFIQSVMPSKQGSTLVARSSRGDNLTGTEATLYALLLNDIQAVANGDRPSTIMQYDAETVYGKTEYTAEELGVEKLIENGKFTEAASQAINDILEFDLSAVMGALMADCPYELYWYDKTVGVSASSPKKSSNGITVTVSGNVTVSFRVSPDYAEPGEAYICSSVFGKSARDAADNAQRIADEYATATDLDRLWGYAEEICNLTSYNHDALSGNVAYGNPWQLVWVFDGNPDTNVVCEGYSKAFQYLCDQTDFSEGISVITVTGNMTGGEGAGPHMWNVVKLEDGNNYLVDVTNIDAGTIGYPDQLFLAENYLGDNASGYVYIPSSSIIEYKYDERTLSQYSADELVLRRTDGCFDLPEGVKTIGTNALSDTAVKAVIVPAGCETVEDSVFANCSQLMYIINRSDAQIEVPDGVTLISLK